ncbi:sulfatase-like hydrolase/transferase [Maridesulfovibrio sp.]|uniref:sulfatase-like hydrolase/transferase n=1 Tax=Maridesulfovibrio sp. TaxID=2795000 RepID=UPI0029CAA6AB|nr:sulfatase-like hydrolase/transferase [Maridesulfovibrio sp.]
MKNIIWIVIDTLRSDMLASCLSDTAVPNAIDKVIEQGVLFTDVMTTGASTRNTAPAYFSGLRPGLTGMTYPSVQSIRKFKDDVITVTEHFKHHGYQTFRWADSSLDSCQPKRGFDVFEAGYPNIRDTPNKTYDNKKRDDFIKKVRQSKKPFFVNFHLYCIHDFDGEKKSSWTTEDYLYIISRQAIEFKSLWDKISPGPEDIAVVTSDHGCILNENYVEYDKAKPGMFTNNRTRVFASFIADGLVPAKKNELIRSIDIAPTLLDMAVGGDMKAQGISLKSVLEGGPVPELIGIAERDNEDKASCITDYACVRKKDWVLYFNNGKPEALYSNAETDYAKDHMGEGLEIEKELFDFYKQTALDAPRTAKELYEQNGLSTEDIRGDIEASILLPVLNWSDKTRLAIESLLDQILHTELILLDADRSGKVKAAVEKHFGERLFLRRVDAGDMNLQQMLNKGLGLATGPFTVTAVPDCQYTENFCYSLRENFLTKPHTVLSYPNLKRLISDNREMEYIGSNECFDELLFSRLGSSFEHKANTAIFSLPHFNEIGACAMFETATLRNAEGFAESRTDVLGQTWHKLNRLGRIRHVNKGLVISEDKTILRPAMPGDTTLNNIKISVIAPLKDAAAIKMMPMFMDMLTKQKEKSIELLVLNSAGNHEFLTTLAENFPKLKTRIISCPEGDSELFNSGLFSAHGEYLFWTDISDKLLPHTLSSLLSQINGKTDVTAVKCGYILHGADKSAQAVQPLTQVREMIREICDLRGLLYRRRLHNDVGIFKQTAETELGWDMCVRLALVKSFESSEEPLIIAGSPYQFNMQPTMESYLRILRNTINCMGNKVDMVRLYEDDFSIHNAGKARYILEEEMKTTLKLINQSGIKSGALLRVPKTY